MAEYKLQKKKGSLKRVIVRVKEMEWNVPALIICVFLALAIWLYVFNSSIPEEVPPADESTPATEESVAESVNAGGVPAGESEADSVSPDTGSGNV